MRLAVTALRQRCRTIRVRSCVVVLLVAVVGTGCTRRYFRNRTDAQVGEILAQKNIFPDWKIEQFHIYPDARARFADPGNPDRPPMPPDDYATRLVSPNPQKPRKAGYGLFEGTCWLDWISAWDSENRANEPENASPEPGSTGTGVYATSTETTGARTSFENVLKTREKPFRLTLEQMTELALFNSREFQDRREDLYVSALPVSLERFAFATQFFATEQAIREVAGSETASGAGNRWQLDSGVGFSRLFPTGATLLVRLANQLVINLGNGKPDFGLSTLSLQLAQPLLRGRGFAVTLEPLTQAERNLLYAIRSYARFRKIYYVYLAGGAEVFNAPYSFAGLNLRGIGPSFTAPSQGYLPTLLLSALERNEAENLRVLEQFSRLYVAFEEGGDVSRLQVDQVEQQLLRSQSSLLQRRLDVNNGLDALKLQLGVPTALPLELDDAGTRPLEEHLVQFTRIQREFDQLRLDASDYYDSARRQLQLVGGTLTNAVLLEVALRPRLKALMVGSKAVRSTAFVKNILPRWSVWEKRTDDELKKYLIQLSAARRVILNRKAELEVRSEKLPSADADRLEEIGLQINLGKFEQFLRVFEQRPWLKEAEMVRVRQQAGLFREVVNLFALVVGEARIERLDKVRKSWPSLPNVVLEGVNLVRGEFDESVAVASRYSLEHRFELMNARGQLVDSWRQIAVRANALQGVLNVGYNLNATSPFPANEPLNVGGSRTTNQLTINGELPLVRRLEANQYRVAQISFQRQRRALQATEDFILNDVRTDLRSLRVLGENYRIQQRAVEVAYAQVENSLDVLQAPPDPRGGGNGQTAGNAAALTQQLLNAQTSLLQAQNSLYTVWVSYLVARMQLYRDLELLPLDARGAWTDERETTDYPPADGGTPSPGSGRETVGSVVQPPLRAGTSAFAGNRGTDREFSPGSSEPTRTQFGRFADALPERLPATVLDPRFAETQSAGFDPRSERGSPQAVGGTFGRDSSRKAP